MTTCTSWGPQFRRIEAKTLNSLHLRSRRRSKSWACQESMLDQVNRVGQIQLYLYASSQKEKRSRKRGPTRRLQWPANQWILTPRARYQGSRSFSYSQIRTVRISARRSRRTQIFQNLKFLECLSSLNFHFSRIPLYQKAGWDSRTIKALFQNYPSCLRIHRRQRVSCCMSLIVTERMLDQQMIDLKLMLCLFNERVK